MLLRPCSVKILSTLFNIIEWSLNVVQHTTITLKPFWNIQNYLQTDENFQIIAKLSRSTMYTWARLYRTWLQRTVAVCFSLGIIWHERRLARVVKGLGRTLREKAHYKQSFQSKTKLTQDKSQRTLIQFYSKGTNNYVLQLVWSSSFNLG